MSESVQTLEHEHHAVEIEREGLFIHLGRRRIRLEYLLLAGMLLLALGFGALFIALDLGKDDLERWGYAGLFGIVLFRSASVPPGWRRVKAEEITACDGGTIAVYRRQ